MKASVTLILADGSTASKSADLKPTDSVAQLISSAAHRIDRKKVTRMVRVLNGKVMVDDQAQCQYLLGLTQNAPKGEHTRMIAA